MKLIIYPNDTGGICVLTPAPECGLSLQEIAAKDVPAGKPYLIVDATDIPSDREFRNAWTADFTDAEVKE
jgi:hypothetical protein